MSRGAEVRLETRGSGCCSCCCVLVLLLCLIVGFLGGVVVGAMVQRKGWDMTELLLLTKPYLEPTPGTQKESMDHSKCLVRMTSSEVPSSTCTVCSRARYPPSQCW